MDDPLAAQPDVLQWHVGALVLLGSLSGLLGRIYGQVPALVPLVAILAVVMGLNLGLLRISRRRAPIQSSGANASCSACPVAAGLAFGWLPPCTTPVLAAPLG